MTQELNDALRRICELQVQYSSENTPAMNERGVLLRGPVRSELTKLRPLLAPALGEFGGDFEVDASDGIGRKTELPWVRFCSTRMSPRATEGFYSVLHFSTDGTAVHVTVGCGSSRFIRGNSILLPDAEIDLQTAWARKVVAESFGSVAPFTDPPRFGATRRLPRSFERATAMSKRVAVTELDRTDLDDLLHAAAKRLRVIYAAQAIGRDVSPADQDEAALATAVDPIRGRPPRQGYGLSPAAKRAVELRAMNVASAWLIAEGYAVKDCSANMPFDFEAVRDGSAIKVEVKGTTADRADAILMTRNEVDLHRSERGKTALLVVSEIRLSEAGGSFTATGGKLESLVGWDIGDWVVEPTAFRLSRLR